MAVREAEAALAIAGMPAIAAPRRDPLLQLDDLEAALALGLADLRGLVLASGFHGLLRLTRFHGEAPLKMGRESNTEHSPLSVSKTHLYLATVSISCSVRRSAIKG
jgi:hypothetical protein